MTVAIWPILGYLFHPLYAIVNAIVCGRMGKEYLAAMGLGSLTLGILGTSISSTFALSLVTRIT